jgi:hypothetical protein
MGLGYLSRYSCPYSLYIASQNRSRTTLTEFVSSVQEAIESELIENGILNYHKPISRNLVKTTTLNGSIEKVFGDSGGGQGKLNMLVIIFDKINFDHNLGT